MIYRNINLDSTGALIAGRPTALFWIYITNTGDAPAYVKLYDKATLATSADTPLMTLMVPAGGGACPPIPNSISFGAGFSARATTGVADNDTTSPGSNEVIVNLDYR